MPPLSPAPDDILIEGLEEAFQKAIKFYVVNDTPMLLMSKSKQLPCNLAADVGCTRHESKVVVFSSVLIIK